MTTLCLDCSKYTKHVDVGVVQQWQAEGVGLLIIQAHPARYGQERSLEIMRAAQAAGMPWDAYLYMYLSYADWVPGALETLDLAAQEGLLPRKVWGDIEDVDSGKGWSPQQRVEAVQRDLSLIDQWAAAHGLPRAGAYGAKWYWDGYLGNTTAFSDRQNWTAQYDNIADTTVFTPYGGWTAENVAVKQYAGSQPDGTDLDVLSAQEEQDLLNPDFQGVPVNPIPPDEPDPRDQRISDLQTVVAVMGGDIADSLANTAAVLHKQASAKRMNRASVGGSANNVTAVVDQLKKLRKDAGA